MSRKFGAARRAAFLGYLAQTGNATVAAERAKVSRSWALLRRSEDRAFAAAWEEALAQARARLCKADERRPAERWRWIDGTETVVRGTGGSGGGKRVQVARARLKQWTARVERSFLSALAASCNVKAACAQVGMSVSSAYAHRARWPVFARQWDAAIDVGYVRLEAALIDNACHFLSPRGEPPPEEPLRDMTVAHAIHIVNMRGRR